MLPIFTVSGDTKLVFCKYSIEGDTPGSVHLNHFHLVLADLLFVLDYFLRSVDQSYRVDRGGQRIVVQMLMTCLRNGHAGGARLQLPVLQQRVGRGATHPVTLAVHEVHLHLELVDLVDERLASVCTQLENHGNGHIAAHRPHEALMQQVLERVLFLLVADSHTSAHIVIQKTACSEGASRS